MLRTAGILLLGLTLGIAAMSLYSYLNRDDDVSGTANSTHPQRVEKRAVIAQGTLEPRNGPILVTGSLLGYKIRSVAVKEGEKVQQGQLLVTLDPAAPQEEWKIAQAQQKDAEERQKAEIERVEHQLASAELSLKQTMDARQLELEAQRKQADVAALKAKQAQATLKRFESLREGKDPLISAQQVEQQSLLTDVSLAERDAANVAYTRLQQSLDFQLQTAQRQKQSAELAVELAKRSTAIDALRGQVELARLKLDQTQITAPTTGTVMNLNAHAGEVITTQPLLQIADLSDMVCLVEVEVSDVSLLSVGQPAKITSRAFHDQKLAGTIERIGNPSRSATLRALDPLERVDRTVTQVVLRIDAQEALQDFGGGRNNIGSALVGLQVEVEFPLTTASPE